MVAVSRYGSAPVCNGWSSLIEQTTHEPEAASLDTKRLLLGTLHIAALTAITLAQPLFDLLGRNAEFFVARQSQPIDIWVMTILLLLAVPAVSLIVAVVAMLIGERTYRVFMGVTVGGLAGAFALQVMNKVLPLNGWILVVAAVICSVVAGIAYNRYATMRSFLTWMAPAPIIVATVFLLFTPVNRLVFPASADTSLATTIESDTPVVLVVWDEFNSVGITGVDGNIDSESYPNYGRLAEDATWYRRASGVSDATSLAVPAIVDGQFPDADLLPIAADHPESLFSILSGSHDVYAREPVTALCPLSICEENVAGTSSDGLFKRMRSLGSDLRVVYLHILLPHDLATMLPPIDRVWGDFGGNAADIELTTVAPSSDVAERDEFSDLRANDHIRNELSGDRVASVRSFIDALPDNDGDRPPFVFLHASLPHAPYRYTPEGRQYTDSGEIHGIDNGLWTGDEWSIAQAEQRYLMQISVTDALLGDLFAWLDAQGWYDDALVIVTADHGVGFTAGDRVRDPTSESFGEIMSVPMLVKLPGQTAGAISDSDVRTTDVFPTILDVLGVEIDWAIEGRSLLLEPIDRGPKRQMRTDGVVVEADPSMPAWDVALATKIRRFGSSGVMDVYEPGNHPLVGMSVLSLDVGEAVGRAQVNGLEAYSQFDSGSGLSLSHITGTVEYQMPMSGEVAVAVNDVVRVVGPFLEAGSGGGRFSYFIPEDAFADGHNEVQLLHVGPDGRLSNIDIDAAKIYSASVYADGNEYLEVDGVGIPITNRLSGGIDSVVTSGTSISISGWAADTAAGRPADEIVLVVDGRSVFVTAPTISRPDVASHLGDESYARSGFTISSPVDLVRRADSVRVFAVSSGEFATELVLVLDL